MIIVTGGTGFIGSNLIAGLEDAGHKRIVVCDTLGQEDKWKNIAKRGLHNIIPPNRLMEYLDEHIGEVEAIFHIGAISSTTEKNVDLIIETNFVLSRTLWNWCSRNKVRFIYASSAATYGDGDSGFTDNDQPEFLSGLRPLNPYGWSKHLVDRYVSSIVYKQEEGGVPPQWCGLKFFNVYGPNEYHKGDQMSVVCKLYPQVAAGASARLFKSHHPDYEDGGQLRDFIYVKDCVRIMLWLFENPKINGLFNVGTGKARSFKDLALATFAAAGIKEKIHYFDMPEELKDRYQYFTQADMTKLQDAGYDIPFTSLEDGIRDYVCEYMSKTDQYR
ncbi:MAG: ADP-glyceromanno-heptose 6-epimerase [Alphaproteobacteria bacterium]|nr:ADP-glyceromanno-heptose 6-epimerase [Alphaproteobacteria bacterium]MCB1551846.1 ADP-glyceromanno-heptose 6-epimerase [Alphaproteobacteria bacterium]MCB9984429.1 ADP-glyceromanno-heptose 6-epimerase [Micavibrio sp.]HPQ50849.1 ADP-glyceromanno-heptose 6-epimerase [Alphaproteobacteria bacterium]HRK97806.1 ADP-glyceromanno-heptose 6-epimerase [Alphaproteobacteria bacterium]